MNSQDKPYEEYEIKMTKAGNFQKKQNMINTKIDSSTI